MCRISIFVAKIAKSMVKINQASIDDINIIVDFQINMAMETENLKLDKDIVIQGVTAVLDDSNKGKYYVAENKGVVIGSLMITKEWSDWRNGWVFWIQSVYVIPEMRGKHIFKKMYDYILNQVNKSNNVAGLRLYVDISNKIARKVYSNIGMDGDHYQVFEWMK